jgi:hypothetical protein
MKKEKITKNEKLLLDALDGIWKYLPEIDSLEMMDAYRKCHQAKSEVTQDGIGWSHWCGEQNWEEEYKRGCCKDCSKPIGLCECVLYIEPKLNQKNK